VDDQSHHNHDSFTHTNTPTPHPFTTDTTYPFSVAYIEEQLSQKRAVYIHCHGGKGRSVVVVLAWMMKTCNIDRTRAYNQLKKQRKIAKVWLYDFVQMDEKPCCPWSTQDNITKWWSRCSGSI
jgi:protein-tyrosine phosphatase